MVEPQDIHQYLKVFCLGRSRAVKAANLARVMGLSLREVNDFVRTLRKSGIIIGAAKDKPYGYYLPQTDDETKRCLNSFRQETFDMLQTFNRMKRSISARLNEPKQMSMFDEEMVCGRC